MGARIMHLPNFTEDPRLTGTITNGTPEIITALDSDLSGFALHNQTHSSASSINMYAAAPHAWVASYLFSRKSPFGAAGKAGVLVEEGVVNTIARGWAAEKALEYIQMEYEKFGILQPHITPDDLKRAETDRKRAAAL